ncbi:MAG: ATP-binding protein [Nanoarchaeota archaeon]|nr:ATP-binding protein [Nanoarchaeota archaeon]
MINKEKWAEIIKDWQGQKLPYLVERENLISPDFAIKRAISIIGPRRIGKTYEMFLIIKQIIEKNGRDKTLYINLERADLGVLNYSDLVNLLEVYYSLFPQNKKKTIWLFLDEIQNVSQWEKFVRTCLDEEIKVFLSGSSAKLLSKEIATAMGGRNLSYTVFPFSFREYLSAKGFSQDKYYAEKPKVSGITGTQSVPYYSSEEKSKLINHFDDYLNWGGYPEAVLFSEQREKILRDIFDTAILKDVIERHGIRNISAMKLLIKALLSSKEFSVHKFYNYLKSQNIKVGKNVLYNYLHYLEDAFFVFPLRKFNLSYKKAAQSLPKIYFIDNGLLRVNQIDDKGGLLENLVFTELLRKEFNISYYQNTIKEEVDFLITEGKKVKKLIQVCYDLDNFVTREREIKSIVKASEEFDCDNLLIITKNQEEEIVTGKNKIKVIPAWKWLLEK